MKHVFTLRLLLAGLALALLASAAGAARADGGGSNAGSALNMVAVGHNDLDGRGFNADVWVYKGYAYVGQWGFGDWANGTPLLKTWWSTAPATAPTEATTSPQRASSGVVTRATTRMPTAA